MRRSASSGGVGPDSVCVEEGHSSDDSPGLGLRGPSVPEDDHFMDNDEGDSPDGPVRKGTMSKDIHGVGYKVPNMTQVMDKAQWLGAIFLLTPPVIIVAHVTGMLHQLAGVVACASAAASATLVLYKICFASKKREKDIMIGFGLYVTTPLCVAASLLYFMTNAWVGHD